MWQTYRRGSSSSYTPLLVSLGACKERSSTVAVEPLRECGLIVSSLAEVIEDGSRRWLVILDGYDEVHWRGDINVVVSNQLNNIKGVKVRRLWPTRPFTEAIPVMSDTHMLRDVYCNVQVIVTCRTECLEVKGRYRALFTPTGLGPGTDSDAPDDHSPGLHELYMPPWRTSQIERYFGNWTQWRA